MFRQGRFRCSTLSFLVGILILLSFQTVSTKTVKADRSGPQLIRDFNRSTGRLSFLGGTFFQGKLYFGAFDSDLGIGLWRTNGTPKGTEQVYSGISPATLSPYDGITRESLASAELNNVLYFGVNNYPDNVQLWRTNGTSGGTYLVKEIESGSNATYWMGEPVAVDGFVWFPIKDNNHVYDQLWRSDGTESGTEKIADKFVDKIAVFNGHGYFRLGSEIMRTNNDGSVQHFATVNIDNNGWGFSKYVTASGWLYFSNASYDSFLPLFATDGETVAIIKQAETGQIIINTRYMVVIDGVVYFSGNVNDGISRLWKFPIGSLEAEVVKEFPQGSIELLTEVGGKIFFRHYYGMNEEVRTLWKSDGTPEGTEQVCSTCNLIVGNHMLAFHEQLYFTNKDAAHGIELWVTDGTDAGTYLFQDINIGPASSYPSYLFADETMLVFAADDGQHGYEPWGFLQVYNQFAYLPTVQR